MCGVLCSVIPLFSLFTNLKEFDTNIFLSIAKSVLPRYIRNTLLIVVVVEIFVVILGSSIAWVTAIFDFPFRKVLIFLQILPLLMPAYISAITWKDALSPHGFMVQWFGDTVASVSPFVILSIVLICNMYPYVYLVTYILFSNMSQCLLDVARSVGSRKHSLFFRIGLPFAKASLLGTSLLVMMELLNAYWVYQYLGYDVITTGIVRVWRLYGNLSIAKILSAGVIVLVMLLVLVKNKVTERQHKNPLRHGNYIVPKCISRKGRVAAIFWCSFPIVIGFIVPLIQLLVWAIPMLIHKQITYNVLPLIQNTLLICVVVIVIQIPLAIFYNYAVRLCRSIFFTRCFSLLSFGYAIPSVIVAILIIGVIRWADMLLPGISVFKIMVNGGIYAISLACVYRYIPIAITSIGSGFNVTNIKYEDAARSLGSGTLHTLFSVCIPINKRFIITACMLTIIDIIKEIPIVSVLHPFNFNTLALKMYYLVNDEQIGQSSVVALLLIFAGILIILPVYVGLIRRRESYG